MPSKNLVCKCILHISETSKSSKFTDGQRARQRVAKYKLVNRDNEMGIPICQNGMIQLRKKSNNDQAVILLGQVYNVEEI